SVNRYVCILLNKCTPWLYINRNDQFIDSLCVLAIGELLLITIRELLKTPWIMVPPRSQIRAWRNLFEPVVQFGAFFADAPRPHAVDQHPLTVGVVGVIVDPFDYNLQATHSCRLRLL